MQTRLESLAAKLLPKASDAAPAFWSAAVLCRFLSARFLQSGRGLPYSKTWRKPAGPLVFCLCLLFAAVAFSAEPFTLTDDFLAYLKTTTNPHEFGLKPDGRFYPYSTARGRRIGYDRPVLDKALYSRGCTKAEAETQLRTDAEKALTDLTRYLAQKHPTPAFSDLSRKSQEMLVDFALSEGATNIPPAVCEAVMKEDWNRLFNDFIYIRWVEKGWPDTARNKAFADRWLDPKSRLRPGPTVAPSDK